ncbi:DUF6106 family protein [Scatolibacter rhodanostii]|uniref:DUF6106 family protein n=1 Tax=Scatolibacter rhodanostii TaxID=2014781 RepID=UPI000C06ECFB|nr:DUF6106 family protein [Scatolibacter rhodanostii]
MNDVFIERMVKKRTGGKDIAIFVLIFLAVIALGFATLLFLPNPSIVFFVVIAASYGGYKLISMRNLEYEYSLTNGYVSVDKIMNRASRKRLTTFECKDIEDMGEYEKNKARLENRQVQTKLFVSEYSDGQGAWYVIVNTKKTGKTLLIFSPDEDLLEAVKKFMPTHLRFELFGRKH